MISFGAITVINAIPCGIGATVGTHLSTRAGFTVRGSERIVRIINDPQEDDRMARICVSRTFEHFRIAEPAGWELSVDSAIPISKGLKSSSSACNSIVSEVSGHIAKEHGKGFGTSEKEVIEMIRLGVRCAREAGVTVTGAFDDACGCHLGGLVITDNERNEILMRTPVNEEDVILLIPAAKIKKPSLNVEKIRSAASEVRELIRTAERDWHDALTKNGAVIADAIGIDDSVAVKAIEMGALAAGVSGTGPAVSVVVKKGDGRSFLKDLEHKGYDAIMTGTR